MKFVVNCLYNLEDHALWMLRRIFRPKMEEMAGGYNKIRSDELKNLYCSENIVG
jgi:hypothetical protein